MLSFLMNQIVIAIKEESILTYLTLFDNSPEPSLPLAKGDCVTKNFETQVILRRPCREDRYHSEKDTHAAPSVTIKAKHVNNQNP